MNMAKKDKAKNVRKDQEQQLQASETNGKGSEQTTENPHSLIIDCARAEQGANEVRAKLSERMLGFSKGFVNQETEEFDVEAFKKACATEETWLKSDEAGENKANRIPNAWRQYKSDIVRLCTDFQGSPADYKTYADLKADLNDLRRQKNGGTGSRKSRKQGDAMVEVKAADPKLMQLVVRIVDLYDQQADAGRDMTIEALHLLIQKQEQDIKDNPKALEKPVGENLLDVDEPLDDSSDIIDEALEHGTATATRPAMKH
jgi:hypothetical protein